MSRFPGQTYSGRDAGTHPHLIANDVLRFFEDLIRFTGIDDLHPPEICQSVLLDDGQANNQQTPAVTLRYREFIRRVTTQLYGVQGRVPQVFDDTDLLCSCLTNCKTIGQALKISTSFDVSKTLPQRTPLTLRQDSQHVVLTLSVQLPGSELTPTAVALELLAILFQYKLLSWLTGARVRLLAATLRFQLPPSDALVGILGDIIGCPLRLAAEENTLVFHREVLQKPVVRSHRELLEVLRSSQIALLPLPEDKSYAEIIATLLRKTLLEGARLPSLDVVAARLGFSNSTLRRHLVREGASFQALLDTCRYEHAVRLLEKPLILEEIAARLGFNSPSSFSFAFKTWTGESPSGFRQKLRATPDSVAGQ